MCEKSIHHMETNKENGISLTEWHSRSPAMDPVAASHAVAPPARPAAYPQCPTPSLSSPLSDSTPRKRGLETWARCCLRESKTAHLRVSFIDVCQIIQAKKRERCSPTPLCIFKKALPTPFPLSKALPSCCHLNIRAPPKEKGIWHAPLKQKQLNRSLCGSVLKWDLTL